MKTYELFEFEGRTYASYVLDNIKTTFDIESDSTSAVEYRQYLAWVEAGNNPEDFWTRDLDSPEGLEQPKQKETTEQPSSTDTKIETDLGE